MEERRLAELIVKAASAMGTDLEVHEEDGEIYVSHKIQENVYQNVSMDQVLARYEDGYGIGSITSDLVAVFSKDPEIEIPDDEGIREAIKQENLFVDAGISDPKDKQAQTFAHRLGHLLLVPRIVIGEDENGITSINVTKEVAEELKLEPEELFETAMRNTINVMPFDVVRRFGPDESSLWIGSPINAITGMFLTKIAQAVLDLSGGGKVYLMPVSQSQIITAPAKGSVLDEMIRDLQKGLVLGMRNEPVGIYLLDPAGTLEEVYWSEEDDLRLLKAVSMQAED